MRREIYKNGELIESIEELDDPRDVKYNQALQRLKAAYKFAGVPTNQQIAATLKDLMYVMRHYIQIDEEEPKDLG